MCPVSFQFGVYFNFSLSLSTIIVNLVPQESTFAGGSCGVKLTVSLRGVNKRWVLKHLH